MLTSNVVYLRRRQQPAAPPDHSETHADASENDRQFETSAFLSAYRRRSLRWLAISLLLSLAFHLAAAALALSAHRTLARLAPPQPFKVVVVNASANPPEFSRAPPPSFEQPGVAAKPRRAALVPITAKPRGPEITVSPPIEQRLGESAQANGVNAAPPVTTPLFAVAYLNNPLPIYPLSARRQGEQGLVEVHALISPAGRPQQVKLGKSSGVASLDEAALDAVSRWSFIPAKRGAEPVAAWVEVPIRFKLEQKD